MDNTNIYEELLLNKCFNKIKSKRNCWTSGENTTNGPAAIIDIGGADYGMYKSIMEQCKTIIVETILLLIVRLLEAYSVETKYCIFFRENVHIYLDSNHKVLPDFIKQNNMQKVLIFSCNDEKHKGVLYIFKEFGINNNLPEILIKAILSENNLKRHCYISLVEEEAYKENLGHNDDPTDPSRGTGVYSLKDFFDSFFDKDEYSVFKTYADKLSNMTKDYLGFEIVRTLRRNTMHNFRKSVRDNLYKVDFSDIDKNGIITCDQQKIIKNNLFTEHNIDLLTGTSLFAQSYMTSEWLFSSLSGAGNIDMTPIVMGYYKSIEQFIFSYISLHTKEKDGTHREIYVGKKKAYANSDGYADLTESLIKDNEKMKDVTMSSLTGFFGYHKETTKPYITRNTDLLSNGISTNTYHFIIDALTKVPETRNQLFHKYNFTDWEKVIEARKCAQQIFCLLLGSYKIDKSDQITLGILKPVNRDDFYKLCEYIAIRSHSYDSVTKRPIYYFNEHDEPDNCLIAQDDISIEYDEYGEPKYSGLYFIRHGDKENVLRKTVNDPPSELWEGEWDLSGPVPNLLGQSGPQKKLFEDGKFLL